MTGPLVSVIVVSRDRPDALLRCLTGLDQVQYWDFEIVVVADPAGAAAVRASRFADLVKLSEFDIPNISAARNLGIGMAAGEVVAFIDDDAVPEPTWLASLTDAFADKTVAATGGYVIGRNGISWQWQGRQVDRAGRTKPLLSNQTPDTGWAVKTEGTNMAVRREVLIALGGFDERYRFFLDETDLNVRLDDAGYRVRLCPDAVVHHGFAASAVRRYDRVPTDLFEIGASWAVFLMTHAQSSDAALRWEEVRGEEHARLSRHLVNGGLEPRDLRHLNQRLLDGFLDAASRGTFEPIQFGPDHFAFQPYPARSRRSVFRADISQAEAQSMVEDGQVVTRLVMSRTALFHHVRFGQDGVWVQRGGLYGKSTRSDPIFRFWTRAERVAREEQNVANLRQIQRN